MHSNCFQRSLTAVFCGLTLASAGLGQDLAKGEKDTVFIGRLNVQPSVAELAKKAGRDLELKRIAESLDTQFINALNATRVFQIVERKRAQDLQEEQAFTAVNVDPNDKNAAQLMKMSGAKYAFLPQIDGFEDRSDSQQYQEIGRTSMSRKLFLSVVVQVVDTTTGKLLPDAPSIQLNKSDSAELSRTGAGAVGSDQALVELAKEMAGKLSQGIVALLRPAKVLAVTGKQILINRGTEAGFQVGAQVELYAVEEVKDEDSGEVFRNETPIGKAKVTRADSKQSFAVISGEDLGIAKGCVVRVLGAAITAAPEAVRASGSEDAGVTPGSSEKPLTF